jgi:NADH-quinone oxidoreductase subunit M
MLSHGFTSGGLFFLIGFLYEKYYTRFLFYYSGLLQIMPIYFFFFFFFSLANFVFPGTANFVGELLILFNLFFFDFFIIFFILISLFLSLVYSILLCIRLFYANLSLHYLNFLNYSDLTIKDFLIIFIIFFFLVVLGIFPSIIFDFLNYNLLFHLL